MLQTGKINGFHVNITIESNYGPTRDSCENCDSSPDYLQSVDISGYHYDDNCIDNQISCVSARLCANCLREMGNFLRWAGDNDKGQMKTWGVPAHDIKELAEISK